MHTTKRFAALALVASLTTTCLYAQSNLVANGNFQRDENQDGVPDNWATAGDSQIKQSLTIAAGPRGMKAAKLACTQFSGDSPSSHAMLCQVGHVGLDAQQWYRLSWQAKAQDLAQNVISVSLSNTRHLVEHGAELFLSGGTRVASVRAYFSCGAGSATC